MAFSDADADSTDNARDEGRTSERKSPSLLIRFHIGLGAIFLVFCAVVAWLIYAQEKQSMKESALSKSYLVLAAVDATRGYIRETLRPRMYEIIGPDDFVIEAMSTSYITRAVMDRFNQVLPEFNYRRAAIRARNPNSELTPAEHELFDIFQANPDLGYWQGIRTVDGVTSFVHARPVSMGASCLHCHGKAEDAPAALLEAYGPERGFGYREGELAGVTAVSIPVNIPLAQIRGRALSTFWVMLVLMTFLYVVISFLFNRTVVRSLKNLLGIFHRGLVDESEFALPETPDDKADIETLANTATALTTHLQNARRQLVGYANDLEQSVDALSHSRDLLQAVFDGIPDDMVLLDSDRTIRMVNRTYLERRNLVESDVLDRACPLDPDDHLVMANRNLTEAMETGQETQQEVHTPTGGIFRIHHYPVLDDAGGIRGILRYARDITMERQVEQRIQQTEKLAAMGQLAAGVAHEINNPIGVVLTYTKLLLHQLNGNARAADDVKVIDKQAQACRAIIADLLKFARSGSTPKAPSQINEPVVEVVDMVRKQFSHQGTEIELDLSDELPDVPFDADRIKQVLMNLLINAHQAIDEAPGHVRVCTDLDITETAVHIIVRDDGVGIAPHLIDKIFDPFFSTKKTGEGTGLGLSVSYGIIHEHGGDIRVASEVGHWTEFDIILPLTGDENPRESNA